VHPSNNTVDNRQSLKALRLMTEAVRRSHIIGVAAMFAAILALVVFLTPITHAASSRASFHKCGEIPALSTWDIRAKRVGCHKARRVARAYNLSLGPESSSTQEVMGFHCKISGYYGDGAYYRCAATGHRVVRFTRGG
jgi:hypothetical protein